MLPEKGTLKGDLPMCFVTFYWTNFGLKGGQSSACGVLQDPAHPLFKYFPTEKHTNWQWWDLLTRCQQMILDFWGRENPWPKSYRPLIHPIDSWKSNRKLALVAEAKVDNGKLLICSIDIENDLDKRPATRQFRKSLCAYLESKAFNPETKIKEEAVAELFKAKDIELSDDQVIAKGTFENGDAAQVVDFGKTIQARYVRIESLSSHSDDNNAAIAEIHLMDADGKRLDHNGWQVIYADSEEIVAEPASAANVIDEQPVTIWHTKYEGEGANTPHPHQIVIDLGGVQSFRSLRYLPRNGANPGKIKGYKIYASEKLFKGLKEAK